MDASASEPAIVLIPRDRTCAAVARQWLERELPTGLERRVLDDLKLLATELVVNAFIHGRGRIELQLRAFPNRVRVEVIDEGKGAAIQIREDGPELGGWGLKLVDKLSAAWGAYEGTTHVWADVSVLEPPSERRSTVS